MIDHQLSQVVTAPDGRVAAWCRCGYSSGYRRNRPIATMSVGAHVAAEETQRVPRAQAIVNDHNAALHEDSYDDTIGCTWPQCEESFALLASLEEAEA